MIKFREHVEVARALYSVPGELIGQRVDVRADSVLVKIYSRGQLVKTHPRVRPGRVRPTRPTTHPGGWSTRYATSPP